ncbi:MAG: hypothetical protein ACFCBW_22840, partial [Candidatus Competibacterales bacterium]
NTLVPPEDPRRKDAPLPPPGPLRALTAGHLSRFDAINVVTELDTHAPGDEAAAKAVQAFINRLLTLPLGEEAVGHPPRLRLADSDPERAFFAGGEAVAAALAQGAEADPVAGEEACALPSSPHLRRAPTPAPSSGYPPPLSKSAPTNARGWKPSSRPWPRGCAAFWWWPPRAAARRC